MEIRQTRMLTSKEVQEDLGISAIHLRTMIELGILKPIRLGRGYKFSQKDLLDFQEKYKGKDLRSTEALVRLKDL